MDDFLSAFREESKDNYKKYRIKFDSARNVYNSYRTGKN